MTLVMTISNHFSRKEFRCKCGCGFDTVDVELVEVLEETRHRFNQPIVINSGCRCDDYNAQVNGVIDSQHLFGRAADFLVVNVQPRHVQDYLLSRYPMQYGIGCYHNFTHIDTRSTGKARWDG